MTKLLVVIISSGVFGGIVNFCQLYSKEYKGWPNFWKCVVVGLGASFLVPLFLQMISSDLINKAKTNDQETLVFIGFCLVASIFSKRFIETIGEKILRQVEHAKVVAEEAKEIAETNREEVDLLASKATEVDPSDPVQSSSSSSTTTIKEQLVNEQSINYEEFGAILKAFRDGIYTFRTLGGVAKEAKVSKEKVAFAIQLMKSQNWIREVKRDNRTLYALTEEGNQIRLSE